MLNRLWAYIKLRKQSKDHKLLVTALKNIADAYETHTGIPARSYIADDKVWVECSSDAYEKHTGTPVYSYVKEGDLWVKCDTIRECFGSAEVLRMNPRDNWKLFTKDN